MEAFRHNIQPEAMPSVDVFTRVLVVGGEGGSSGSIEGGSPDRVLGGTVAVAGGFPADR